MLTPYSDRIPGSGEEDKAHRCDGVTRQALVSETGGEGSMFVLSMTLKAVNLWPQFLDSNINLKKKNAK